MTNDHAGRFSPGSWRLGHWNRWTTGLVSLVLLATLLPLGNTPAPAHARPVAADNSTYGLCGRVFPDPHAYWPSPEQAPNRSPFAKGNAACASNDFLAYQEMIDGLTYLESLFPDFVEFYELEEDFGEGLDCDSADDPTALCSAGLPQQGAEPGRVRSDLYMVKLTDERVPDDDKRFFNFPLSIHGIERAGAESGARAAEDLAIWGYCEAKMNGEQVAEPTGAAEGATINCEQEDPIPHPLLETQPDNSVSAGQALKQSAVYFVFPNPDGWRRGDPENGVRFFQRYNGNGVDLNRDWPTQGFTFRPYTPWSEPETRGFGKVLKGIRDKWDGGIDLHGQLQDRAFSFTLLGASERDYGKDQRILQTVKGAWRDAEKRFAWAETYIKPNDAPPRCIEEGGELPSCDNRMYGVQWGTVWDTIDYTVTGSLGDWIDSPIGLGADGIDNEMSFSHLVNCGVGSCYLIDYEQLHVDGNKSLVYSMINFTLQDENQDFEAPGKVGYVHDSTVLRNDGTLETPPPSQGLDPQEAILDQRLDPSNDFIHEFEVKGPSQDVYNGGVEAKVTSQNVGGVSSGEMSSIVLEQFRAKEEDPGKDEGPDECGEQGGDWSEVNRYFNQSFIYLQAGQAVHANAPLPGRWRVCLTGGLVNQIETSGGYMDLDISFSREKALEDPGQLPYAATNMNFFDDLGPYMRDGQLQPVRVNDVLSGRAKLDRFTSLVIADDAFPGYTEPTPTGPAQRDEKHANPGVGTVPCAYQQGTTPLPPTCVNDFEFEVDSQFNNREVTVDLTTSNPASNDWDLFLERFSETAQQYSDVGSSTTPTGNESVGLTNPPVGKYRARVVNWAAEPTSAQELAIDFSNEGPKSKPSKRSNVERKTWGKRLERFAKRGGNLVLTDGAIKNLAYMGLVPRSTINNFTVYAGYISFSNDAGETSTYEDPLAADVNQPGAAEGPDHRHQTWEPTPMGFAIQNEDGADKNSSPVWAVDQKTWEKADGRTAGVTTLDQASLGEMKVGKGRVRIIGSVLPMPTEEFYHPFGLADYSLTYSGYQVLNNTLQWERPNKQGGPGDGPGGSGPGGNGPGDDGPGDDPGDDSDDPGDEQDDDVLGAGTGDTGDEGSGLPFTGSDLVWVALVGALLVVGGTALVRRRRRGEQWVR